MRGARILTAGLLALALAACNGAERDAPGAANSPTPTASPQSLPPGETTAPVPPESDQRRSPGETRPSPEPDPAECGADKLSEYLNLLPTSEVMAKIRAAVGHDRIRTIRPGDVVTMDFRPDRLNIEVGEDGRITLFRCG